MMIRFQTESFDEAYSDLGKMLEQHFDEVGENKDVLGAPDGNLGAYRALEQANSLLCLTARDGDDLIGYLSAIISPHLHYQTIVTAAVDVYYVDPRYRGDGVGERLFRRFEHIAAERGAKLCVMQSKEAHDHSPLFEALGYRPYERHYCKRLKS